MKTRHKIAVGVAAVAVPVAAAWVSIYLGIRSADRMKPELLAESVELRWGSVSRMGHSFEEAMRKLNEQPNMENAYKADRVGALYFLCMYGATNNMPEDYRQIMWANNFLYDANSCIQAYRAVGDNNDITSLIGKMAERIKIGQTLALEGPSKGLGERVSKIFNEYVVSN